MEKDEQLITSRSAAGSEHLVEGSKELVVIKGGQGGGAGFSIQLILQTHCDCYGTAHTL